MTLCPTLIISVLSRDYNVSVKSPQSLSLRVNSVKSAPVSAEGTKTRSGLVVGSPHEDVVKGRAFNLIVCQLNRRRNVIFV